MDQMGNLAQV